MAASSSAADPYAQDYRGPDRRPFSAIDGRGTTEWLSALGDPEPWLQINLPARTVREISLSVANASQITELHQMAVIDPQLVDVRGFWQTIAQGDHVTVFHAGREELNFLLRAVGASTRSPVSSSSIAFDQPTRPGRRA